MGQTAQSSTEKNKQFVLDFVENAFNRHDMASIDRYYARDLRQHIPQVSQGDEGFKQYFGQFFQTFPDSRTTIDHIVAEGDKVFAMMTTTAKEKQTGKRVTIKTDDLFRIENGMIVEQREKEDKFKPSA
jgi:predicted SnoaL-like aldol condensation-catalyzing enzyme